MALNVAGKPQSGPKRSADTSSDHCPPQKKVRALLEEDETSDGDDSSASDDGGIPLNGHGDAIDGAGFKINEEFARRFEHNKKREELHKLQEKYGKTSSSNKFASTSGLGGDEHEGADSSTDSEDEDDEGVLASQALDAQIQDTLEAIRKKDPRVYDKEAKFYNEAADEAVPEDHVETTQTKPMYLSDYHRRNLLQGEADPNAQDDVPPTYAQQQDDLKNIIVKEMHATANDGHIGASDHDEADGEDFLVPKPPSAAMKRSRSVPTIQGIDVETADRDPETYLSNFMSARAWIPHTGSQFQAFESDNESEEHRAEEFEEAYNLRFEDPTTSNEKLLSHARDAAAKYSVRKESLNPRKRAREAERSKKDAAKQLRDEEKARLRKLKVAEIEEKLQSIKDAAGLKGESLREDDWSTFLEKDWDDEQWEREMKKRFGEDYYADRDFDGQDEGKRKKKTKKPKWDQDINISDLVPEFEAGKESAKTAFELSDDSDIEGGASLPNGEDKEHSDGEPSTNPPADQKPRRREREEKKKEVRRERRKVELLVDEQMRVDETLARFGKKHTGQFRYRETSPSAFGLTPHDILMASDTQLNQYAGLKKMAAFRDPDKKKRDKKHLGKKARLRKWRAETFGSESGPQQSLAEVIGANQGEGRVHSSQGMKNDVDIREGKRRKA